MDAQSHSILNSHNRGANAWEIKTQKVQGVNTNASLVFHRQSDSVARHRTQSPNQADREKTKKGTGHWSEQRRRCKLGDASARTLRRLHRSRRWELARRLRLLTQKRVSASRRWGGEEKGGGGHRRRESGKETERWRKRRRVVVVVEISGGGGGVAVAPPQEWMRRSTTASFQFSWLAS